MTDIEVQATEHPVMAVPGDRIILRIPENATTGYEWAVDQVDGPLEVESNELVPPGDARPGAGGERVIVLGVRETGEARVVLSHRRSWEAEPIDRRELAVTIG
jgi:inhibitor of cysteine peptidase